MACRATYSQTAKYFSQEEPLSRHLRESIIDSSYSLFGFRYSENSLYSTENRQFLSKDSIDYLVKSFQFYKQNPLNSDEMFMASWVGSELSPDSQKKSFDYYISPFDLIKSMKSINFFKGINTLYFPLQECASLLLLHSDYEQELNSSSGKGLYSAAADVLLHSIRKGRILRKSENLGLRINSELGKGYSELFLIIRKIIKDKENGTFLS